MRRLLVACLVLSAVPAFASDSGEACDHPSHREEAPPAAQSAPARIAHPGAPTLGRRDAKVEVVVFSDFECPYCKRGAETVKALREKYGDRIRIVFMNQPLPVHEHARLAASAAMAAHAQGKFWQMHDWLFAHQKELSRENILAEAAALGMNRQKLEADLDSGVYEAVIQANQDEGKKAGVVGTPTFFVNGQRIQGAQPVDAFTEIIDRELAR